MASFLQPVWAVAIVELLEALCSRSSLLRESLWQHWLQVDFHRLDKDVLRLKEKMSQADLQFVRKDGGDGFSWTLASPPHKDVHRVGYVFAGASHKEGCCWEGGAVSVIDSLGHVWLRDRARLRANGLSTTLVEASMIVGSVRSVIRCVLRHMLSVGSIWHWSDSLEGVQGVQPIWLSNKVASNHRPSSCSCNCRGFCYKIGLDSGPA